MKIKWLIQDVNISNYRLNQTFNALERLEYDFVNIGVIPFTNWITNLENALEKDTLFVILGGVKILNLLNNVKHLSELNENLTLEQLENSDNFLDKLRSAIFYDVEKFDYKYYSQFDIPLLNSNSEYYLIKDNLYKTFNEDKFVKPSRDLKAFDAGILNAGQTFKDFIESQFYQKFYVDEYMLVSSLKKIYAEYRFFIVDKNIVGYSQYKIGNRATTQGVIPNNIIQKAKEYCKLYQPSDIFTMDLANTEDGIKIIEYNCWNASGSYDCDLINTYFEINKYLLDKNKGTI